MNLENSIINSISSYIGLMLSLLSVIITLVMDRNLRKSNSNMGLYEVKRLVRNNKNTLNKNISYILICLDALIIINKKIQTLESKNKKNTYEIYEQIKSNISFNIRLFRSKNISIMQDMVYIIHKSGIKYTKENIDVINKLFDIIEMKEFMSAIYDCDVSIQSEINTCRTWRNKIVSYIEYKNKFRINTNDVLDIASGVKIKDLRYKTEENYFDAFDYMMQKDEFETYIYSMINDISKCNFELDIDSYRNLHKKLDTCNSNLARELNYINEKIDDTITRL